MRQGKATYMFPGSNTSAGFLSFYRDGLKGLDNVFILKGGPGTGKSTLMRKIGLNMLERGYDVEFWQCSSDNDSLDGVLFPALSAAIVDGTAPHTLDAQYPGAVEELVDLGQYWRGPELKRRREEIIDLSKRISEKFSFGYALLREAGALREEEQQQAPQPDAQLLARRGAELNTLVFGGAAAVTRHLFCSAVTPRGLVNFAPALFRRASRRFILVGPVPATAVVIAELLAAAEEKGHPAEVFHPTLSPDSIELLHLPLLDTAVLAMEQAPAEPQPGEAVIVLTQYEPVEEIDEQVEQKIEAAAAYLAEAKALHDQLETVYRRAMDFPAVEAAGNQLFSRLLTLAAEADKD